MQFIPELNLNKHPKDCKNYSLVDAMDIKLSNDLSCIQNENRLKVDSNTSSFSNIRGVIECNKELIIFEGISLTSSITSKIKIEIHRYNETHNQSLFIGYFVREEVNGDCNYVKYNKDVTFKGTFTYNINNDLIISFVAEGTDEPLYTANLGCWDSKNNFDKSRSDIKNGVIVESTGAYSVIFANKASLVPEVRLPQIKNVKYTKGHNYKGWYHFFIRYKINKIDYTQWYHIGYPILINNIERQDIIKYYEKGYPSVGASHDFDGIRLGCSDYFGTQLDTTNEGVEFNLNYLDQRYDTFQIGCICVTNTLQKALYGYDIHYNISRDVTFVVDSKWFREYNVNDLLTTYNNYYNVNTITNYKNRLYIGNYKEHNTDLQAFTDDNVCFKPIKESVNDISSDNHKGSVKAADNSDNSESYEVAMDSMNSIPYIDTKETFNDRKINRTLLPNEYYKFYIHYVDKYGIASEGYPINTQVEGSGGFLFTQYTNYNDDIIFKIFNTHNDTEHFDYTQTTNYGYYTYLRFKISVKVNSIPDGYEGYFISYEKFNRNSITGVFCKKDVIDNSEVRITTTSGEDIYVPELKTVGDGTYQFFSENLYEDNIKLNYDIANTLHFNFTKGRFNSDDKCVYSKLTHYLNLNAPMLKADRTILQENDIEKLEYKLANDNDRLDKGTCLNIKLDSYIEPDIYANKVAILYNSNFKEQYLNKNKDLIKLSDVFYNYNVFNNIDYGYNGCITFNCPLIYCDDGVKLDTRDISYRNLLKLYNGLTESDKLNITHYIARTNVDMIMFITKFIQYTQIPVYNDYFFETKEFKNKPDIKLFLKHHFDEDTKADDIYETGCFVLPANSMDLFTNKIKSQDEFNPIIYSNFTDNTKVTEFSKVVRRSAVMSDEGFDNAWRKFPTEDYKQIFENKGKITNIIGIGNYLLIHTEHSLFAFNASNKLKTSENGDIEVSNPDIWDVTYQEIISSELGMCGLQDNEAYILDEFGYIFYDNDAHRIYKFSSGNIDRIDTNIEVFLDKYKPSKIRFGCDKESSRLLLNVTFNSNATEELCLSYNYKIGTFVSRHSYNFTKAYKTKQNGYFIIPNNNGLYIFDYNNKANINYAKNTYIDIICNTQYQVIKALEFIMYKLYKVEQLNQAYSPSAVDASNDRRRTPYSGINLKVKSDLNETALLDITTNIQIDRPTTDNSDNYKKPYFDLGNWNYNYLRDTRDENMRINGNYFVIHLELNNNDDTNRIEFEGIECETIKFR